jgi:hypothetical protein
MAKPNNKVIIYKALGGSVSLEVKLEGETVWLSLNQMADLFERDKWECVNENETQVKRI